MMVARGEAGDGVRRGVNCCWVSVIMGATEPILSPHLIIVCVVMAVAAALVSRWLLRSSAWSVPTAALRAAVQLAAVATVLAAAMSRLWSSLPGLALLFPVDGA